MKTMLSLARHRIETNRLILRQLDHDDADRLVAIANRIEIARNLATMPHPYSLEDAKTFIGKARKNSTGAAFALVEKASGDIIGIAGWGPATPGGPIDFGYWLGLDYWGKGFATEAAGAVLTHAFCLGRVDEILTDCRIDNPASRRILDKLGFEGRGPSTRYSLGAGEEAETEKVGLRCDRWLAMKACA
jgi:RimJ/RimL family protein N-acetyltransferase